MRRCLLAGLMALLAQGCSSGGTNPKVIMETSMGNVTIELFPDRAPITVRNFLDYVDKRHYDGTIFHRVIEDFMIQGGGMTPDMKEKPTAPPIRNESSNGLRNERGTVAMARTPMPDSATDQFFVNVVDNSRKLDPSARDAGYVVFGRVIAGMDVVDTIRRVRTTSRGPFDDMPVETILIKSIRRVEEPKAAK